MGNQYKKACQENMHPNSFKKPTWAELTLEPLLKLAGDAAPLIFNSMLVLWWLKLCEYDLSDKYSSDDDSWRENIAGRLANVPRIMIESVADMDCQHYHIWLCRKVNIKLLKVVVNYMEVLRAIGLLPQAMILSLIKYLSLNLLAWCCQTQKYLSTNNHPILKMEWPWLA